MDYNKLHSFVYVARLGSISKAASNLYLSQQAVSQQMAVLEEELELKLLKRLHNRIYLTKEGVELYEFARERYSQLNEFLSHLKCVPTQLEGQIRLGCMGEYAARYLTPVIKQFKREYPKVKFIIHLAPDFEIEDKIIKNRVDIGLLINYRNKALLEYQTFQRESFVLVCTPIFLEKYGPFDDADHVMNAPFIDYTENLGAFGRWLRSNFKSRVKFLGERTPDIIIESDLIAKKLILEGTVIGFLPLSQISKDLNDGGLIQILADKTPVQTHVDIVQLKKRTASVAIDAFIEGLVQNEYKV